MEEVDAVGAVVAVVVELASAVTVDDADGSRELQLVT